MDPVRHLVTIDNRIKVGCATRLLLIAGPCQIEGLELCLRTAEALQQACFNLPIDLVFKGSFDKANRTSAKGERGPGLEKGLQVLATVKERSGLPILSDIHLPTQAALVAEVLDIIQIPAFLCRQTDLIAAAAATGKPLNIKKGQFLAPEDMGFAAEKAKVSGNDQILLCERGTCFGYRDLVVDFRSLILMRDLGYPVIFDGTHSVQSMGGAGGASSGSRRFIRPLVSAAVAVGIDGLFLECHPDPKTARSDRDTMLSLAEMGTLLTEISDLWSCKAP